MDNRGRLTKTCCCCIPIRTGVWILAILGLIGAIGSIAHGGITLVSGRTAIDMRTKATAQDVNNAETMLTITKGGAWLELGLGAINLLLSILVMHGLSKYKPGKLRIWVCINTVFLVLGGVGVVVVLILFATATRSMSIGVVGFLIIAPFFGLSGYYVCVVHQYANILKAEGRNRANNVAVVYSAGAGYGVGSHIQPFMNTPMNTPVMRIA